MIADTEAMALLRELDADMSAEGSDIDVPHYRETMTNIHQKVIAFLARRDEDSDVTVVSELLNEVQYPGSWPKAPAALAAFARIAARLRDGFPQADANGYERGYVCGRKDERRAVYYYGQVYSDRALSEWQGRPRLAIEAFVGSVDRGEHLK